MPHDQPHHNLLEDEEHCEYDNTLDTSMTYT